MQYFSTRNFKIRKNPSEAILEGIAADGGLYLPEDFTKAQFPMEKLMSMSAKEISAEVLSLLFGGEEKFAPEGFAPIVSRAYNDQFDREDYAHLARVDEAYVMELYHGPTCAFKDVALQLLPQLMAEAKKATDNRDETVILTATSGDTGSAALAGFSDVDGVSIIVFYPKDGTSAVQERQMVSCTGKNTCVCAIEGNFDDAQSGVKQIFATMKMPAGKRLSSANSINIGRLAPQVAYYFKAYRDLLNEDEIVMGDKVNFVVPTGNFGDILAGYFSMQMGLPVGKLICASNENKVLTDFFETGVYDKKREFHVTKSPSMDILISSNLERLIAMLCGTEACTAYMKDLKENGAYTLTAGELAKLREVFDAGYTDDADTLATIAKVYTEDGYLMDTHTAVAWSVYKKWAEKTGNTDKTVILSTASAYKFASSILDAMGKEYEGDFDAVAKLHALTGIPMPKSLENIESAPIVHKNVIKKDEMFAFVSEKVGK